jgi:signal transduction histidine kinase
MAMTSDVGFEEAHGSAFPSHSVRFFTDVEYPAERIAGFLEASLSRGEAAMLLATPNHQASVTRSLEARGLDLDKSIETGRLRLGNAEAAASSIVERGRAKSDVFEAMIAAPLREAVRRYGAVRAYGEIVNVLAEGHDLEGALALERLWDGLLSESRSAKLLCGYSLGSFSGPGSTGDFSRICDAHSGIEATREQRTWSVPRLLAELEQRTLAFERELEHRFEAERERDVLIERADAAHRAKHEFLAMLGHELRNPLSPILTAVQLMGIRAEGALPKERRIIERQVNHMVRLVDDLLDVSRVARGKVELKLTPVEIAHVVTDAIEMASPLLEERSHRLVTSVPASGLLVDADADRLAQALGNLLTNAAKYTPPGGVVTVTACRNDRFVEIRVRDDGVGIAPELLPHVFDLFVQGRQGFDRPHGGLGLGLSIAKNLIEMHGGSLRGESEGTGRGSLFTIELELFSRRVDESRARSTSAVATRAARRILVVDDNKDAADGFGEFLEASGHVTLVVYDAVSALEAASEFRPEVALLDLGLPVMDGHELARRLRSLLSEQPPKLVAITGYGDQLDGRRSSESGFDHHVLKPVDPSELFRLIEDMEF